MYKMYWNYRWLSLYVSFHSLLQGLHYQPTSTAWPTPNDMFIVHNNSNLTRIEGCMQCAHAVVTLKSDVVASCSMHHS